jgi:hypothetical protein
LESIELLKIRAQDIVIQREELDCIERDGPEVYLSSNNLSYLFSFLKKESTSGNSGNAY